MTPLKGLVYLDPYTTQISESVVEVAGKGLNGTQ
jgi:hypothetical protein